MKKSEKACLAIGIILLLFSLAVSVKNSQLKQQRDSLRQQEIQLREEISVYTDISGSEVSVNEAH